HPIVNLCTGRATSFADLAEALARQLDVAITVRDLGWARGGSIVGDAALLRALVPVPPSDRLPDLARSILGAPGGAGANPRRPGPGPTGPSPTTRELTGEHR